MRSLIADQNPLTRSICQSFRELYEKFFRGYTRKQWGLDPSELDASVTARVPTRTNRDARYFTDHYQAMPKNGYTRMFESMLDSPRIKVMLNCDYREIVDEVEFGEMIYTGPVDSFFDYRYGKLPYRSLEFKHETHDVDVFQEAPVVNYPQNQPYTRVTEFKYLTGQTHQKTSIVYEYPQAEGDPYYPIPRPENAELYAKYKALADAEAGVHFVGRLATYKYYNMDQIVAQALTTYGKIEGMKRKDAALVHAKLPAVVYTAPKSTGIYSGVNGKSKTGYPNGSGKGNGVYPKGEGTGVYTNGNSKGTDVADLDTIS